MDIHYNWVFGQPEEKLLVHMENQHKDGKVFDATMSLHRTPLTPANCARVLMAYPLMTVQVIGRIYWQAFRLYLKRTPFYSHPGKTQTSFSRRRRIGETAMTTKTSVIHERIAPTTTPKPRFLDGIAKRALISRLEQIEHGEVILREEDQQYQYGQCTSRCPHSVTITIYDPKFYSEVAYGGSIGAGEAYMAGYWQASDLTALIRIFLCNRKVLDGMDGGLAWFTIPLQKLLHRLNRNTVSGSQKTSRPIMISATISLPYF